MRDVGYSVEQLSRDLVALGVSPGDVLFVHSSYKSLGVVNGGAGSVIDAFGQTLGPDGLLLMPSFNLVGDLGTRVENWDRERTASCLLYTSDAADE